MSSRTSSSSIGIFGDACLRRAHVAAAYLLIWLVPLLSLLYRGRAMADGGMEAGGQQLLAFSSVLGVFLTLVASYAAVLRNFNFAFDRVAAPFYGSLPIRRRPLFRSLLLASLVPLLLANLVLALLLLVLGGMAAIGPMDVLVWFAEQGLMCVTFCGIASLCMVVSGRASVATTLFCMVNGYVAVVQWGVRQVVSILAPSVVDGSFPSLAWASPAVYLVRSLSSFQSGRVPWRVLLAYALVGVVCTVVATELSARRDLERAGDAFAFRPVHEVASVLFALAAGLGVSLVILALFVDFVAGSPLVVGAVVVASCALVYCVAEAGVGGGITALRGRKAGLAVTVAVSAAFAVCCATDAMGVVRYVPSVDDVKSVSVNNPSLTFESREGISQVVGLHKSLVASGATNLADGSSDYNTVDIAYTLRDGTLIRREYAIDLSSKSLSDKGSMGSVFRSFLQSAAASDAACSMLRRSLIEDTSATDVSLDYCPSSDAITWHSESIPVTDYKALEAALEQDVRAHGAWAVSGFQGSDDAAFAASLSVGATMPGTYDYQVLTFTLSESRTPNTVKWLKQRYQIAFIKASETS
ncbi:MAG: hypothetical protein LKJ49_02180 [Olsenella sp.]|jgi:hypothetical protein|nr:hypothetical protein [Olsenella sp.]